MWQLEHASGARWHDERLLAASWRDATPFPHLVFDNFVPADRLDTLMIALEEEHVARYEGDLFGFEASAPEPASQGLEELRAEFARVLCPPLSRITNKPVTRVDMRAYAYRAGDYLLPHSDHQDGLARVLAYAYYLPSPEPPVGGELELFRVELAQGEAMVTESASMIEARANRLAVFEVSDVSLHQVREVLGGLRISLAGWFYA
ncbi:hypothetical protein BH11MYX1_BH11MYX1_56700 [soil metagenome]